MKNVVNSPFQKFSGYEKSHEYHEKLRLESNKSHEPVNKLTDVVKEFHRDPNSMATSPVSANRIMIDE